MAFTFLIYVPREGTHTLTEGDWADRAEADLDKEAGRYILVQRNEGVSLATKWLDDAGHFGLGPNVLVEIDFEAFIDGTPTNVAYANIRARNAHLLGQLTMGEAPNG